MNNRSSETTDERPVTKLATILGRWRFEEGRAVFVGSQNPDFPMGISVSNVRFLEGEARVTVQRTTASPANRSRRLIKCAKEFARYRLTAPAIARLLRISVGKARRIAVKMALERMNTELARSRVQLGDPA